MTFDQIDKRYWEDIPKPKWPARIARARKEEDAGEMADTDNPQRQD